MMNRPRYWGVIPAAGKGTRMGAELPKQYLELAGRRVLEHTLNRLAADPRIVGIVVALGADDTLWPRVDPPQSVTLLTVTGGAERCHSVLNALDHLAERADEHDWVLVHDAARPCLRVADLARLIDTLTEDPVGGLLALPVHDTMKRASADRRVLDTVNRDGLWHALTPQMFRLGALRAALKAAIAAGFLVTDEAAAMEWSGHRPRLVEGSGDNLKITRPEDLPLAEYYLGRQAPG
ncbi:MAG: 2-C-methyl-D-erythritol 4-phosphate cytidylyltransferase [Chromatiales bacterium 21-64-14]|nr:MAG: 2-C-methyl-D-erythritol 4-phosphate cytidylyltransferase [Chromatiales bacterium 21-64-14]HQU15122.1 2-C-methyl-D-erythritol 4-phosphate cytidylyltransferase [Gammaproteobacteria bacterium]